jgi:hypothetical protein
MGSIGAASTANAVDRPFPLRLIDGPRLMIDVKINGHPVQGSGKSPFEAQLVSGVKLEALGLQLEDQTVAIVDLSDVGHRV